MPPPAGLASRPPAPRSDRGLGRSEATASTRRARLVSNQGSSRPSRAGPPNFFHISTKAGSPVNTWRRTNSVPLDGSGTPRRRAPRPLRGAPRRSGRSSPDAWERRGPWAMPPDSKGEPAVFTCGPPWRRPIRASPGRQSRSLRRLAPNNRRLRVTRPPHRPPVTGPPNSGGE